MEARASAPASIFFCPFRCFELVPGVSFNQSTSSLRMKGPLGDDEVILTSFTGSEAVSQLFSFQIEFLSTKLELAAKDLIGKSVTIEVAEKNIGDRGDADVRYFHGYITRFSAGSISPFKAEEGSPSREYSGDSPLAVVFDADRTLTYFSSRQGREIYL